MNKVDVRRVKVLNNFQYNKGSILYWMQRDKRVCDNWALLYAQQQAIENDTTLHVCFSLNGNFPEANVRQYSFMLHGLIETSQKLEDLNIKFSLTIFGYFFENQKLVTVILGLIWTLYFYTNIIRLIRT